MLFVNALSFHPGHPLESMGKAEKKPEQKTEHLGPPRPIKSGSQGVTGPWTSVFCFVLFKGDLFYLKVAVGIVIDF